MGFNIRTIMRIIAYSIMALIMTGAGSAGQRGDREGSSKKGDNKSNLYTDAEKMEYNSIQKEKDISSKIKEAADFLKKNPNSRINRLIATNIATAIAKEADAVKQKNYSDKYLVIFLVPDQAARLHAEIMRNFINAKKYDEAFQKGETIINLAPDDIETLSYLCGKGADLVTLGNEKYAKVSLEYGLKAIDILEGDNMPYYSDPESWNNYKNTTLPTVYKASGVLSLMLKKDEQASTMFRKAIAANPSDQLNYALLANLLAPEAQALLTKAKSLIPGQLQDDMNKKGNAKLDEMIELYAHAVALSEPNPQLAGFTQTVRQSLEAYYKFRHGNKTDGLQAYIDSFKKPAETPKAPDTIKTGDPKKPSNGKK